MKNRRKIAAGGSAPNIPEPDSASGMMKRGIETWTSPGSGKLREGEPNEDSLRKGQKAFHDGSLE